MTAESDSPPRPGRGALERLYAARTAISAALDDELRLLQRIAEELATLLDARYAAIGILGDDGQVVAMPIPTRPTWLGLPSPAELHDLAAPA
jgi:hypothetical protein